MKMTKTLITGIAAAVALSMTVHAEAGNKKGKRDGAHGRPDREAMEKRDEANGRPDREAMEKRRAAIKAKMLKKFDADKDGKLSEDERKLARETMAKQRKKIHQAVLKQFDKDGDGKLSQDERVGVGAWVRENYPDAVRMRPLDRKGANGRPDRKAMEKPRAAIKGKMLEKFDADKDGKLSDDERKLARETMAKQGKDKEIRQAVLKQFDKDGDGKLSQDEREGLRGWVRENYPDAIRTRHLDRKGGKGGRRARKGTGRTGSRGQGADAAN